jgi:hypothetical protein
VRLTHPILDCQVRNAREVAVTAHRPNVNAMAAIIRSIDWIRSPLRFIRQTNERTTSRQGDRTAKAGTD